MVVQAAKGAAKKSLDWARIIAHTNPDLKKNITDTLSRNQELSRLISEAKLAKPNINWSYYAASCKPADAAWLQGLQKKAESFKPSPVDTKAALDKAKADEATWAKKADAFLALIQQKTEEAKDKLAKFQALPPVDDMSKEDYYSVFPEAKEEFMDKVRRDIWFLGPVPKNFDAYAGLKDDHHHHHDHPPPAHHPHHPPASAPASSPDTGVTAAMAAAAAIPVPEVLPDEKISLHYF